VVLQAQYNLVLSGTGASTAVRALRRAPLAQEVLNVDRVELVDDDVVLGQSVYGLRVILEELSVREAGVGLHLAGLVPLTLHQVVCQVESVGVKEAEFVFHHQREEYDRGLRHVAFPVSAVGLNAFKYQGNLTR